MSYKERKNVKIQWMEILFILVGFYINFLKVEAKLSNHKNTMI